MRMKRSRVQKYHLRSREAKKDTEGNTSVGYGGAVGFSGEAWPASGKVQAEIYGERLSYIRNVKVGGAYVITTDREGTVHYVYPGGLDVVENDGICLHVPTDAGPDYRIISIKPYPQLRLECERL